MSDNPFGFMEHRMSIKVKVAEVYAVPQSDNEEEPSEGNSPMSASQQHEQFQVIDVTSARKMQPPSP